MFALGIRYLNGFTAAALPDAREHAEWPPHPGRIFMALAAAHFETGADRAEREALAWLEALAEAPNLAAADALERAFVTHYVPVNDRAGPSAGLMRDLPLSRDRQPRTFARAYPNDHTVFLAWPLVEPPAGVQDTCVRLCGKVTRIGHSSSLVHMWVAAPGEVPQVTWVPAPDRATIHLRVAMPGTLEELERRYNAGAIDTYAELLVDLETADTKTQKAAKKRLNDEFPNGKPPRLRPQLSFYQGYARPAGDRTAIAPGTAFSPHPLVLRLERDAAPYSSLDLCSVVAVITRWREAILSRSNGLADRIRELLSGHDVGGAPLDAPHLAFLPLAFVGHPHADGRMLGMGLTLPVDVTADERRSVLRAVGAVRTLALGRLGRWNVVPDTAASPPWNLRPSTWTAHPNGATHWTSVTPVVFDRHPKGTDRGAYMKAAAAMIANSCMRIGLPAPRDVIVTHVSAHAGVPLAFEFPRFTRKDGSERRHAHAILVFAEPVCGPVLIGAGRYRGYGLCRPILNGA